MRRRKPTSKNWGHSGHAGDSKFGRLELAHPELLHNKKFRAWLKESDYKLFSVLSPIRGEPYANKEILRLQSTK